ncbi:MAG: thiamine-phosphate kinase [Halobacteriales archaeon]
MDERAALALVSQAVGEAGDDAAVVDGQVLTIDMLHESTDFPDGTTRYTVGWRTVGASLSDVAAMGADANAAVAVYGDSGFDERELLRFVEGARDVAESVNARYVGGDLDEHREFTVATTALGWTDRPVYRSGASPGELVAVTGTLGRSAAAVEAFDRGDRETANDLFRFQPRVAAGTALREYASAMMDSSDGLARSLHQLAAASDCGFDVRSGDVPVDDAVAERADTESEALDMGMYFGEDFELVFTLPEAALEAARSVVDVPITVIGEVTDGGLRLDGKPLPDRGYTHG